MVLILHVIIALSTVGIAGLTALQPTGKRLKLSYLLTAGTFISGTYLVVMSPSHLVSACFTGLVFLGLVGSMLIAARHKLSSLTTHA